MQEEKARKGSPLLELMADLAKKPKHAAAFAENPDEVMAKYKIPEKQQTALKTALKDLRKGKTDKMERVIAKETVHPDTCFLSIP